MADNIPRLRSVAQSVAAVYAAPCVTETLRLIIEGCDTLRTP